MWPWSAASLVSLVASRATHTNCLHWFAIKSGELWHSLTSSIVVHVVSCRSPALNCAYHPIDGGFGGLRGFTYLFTPLVINATFLCICQRARQEEEGDEPFHSWATHGRCDCSGDTDECECKSHLPRYVACIIFRLLFGSYGILCTALLLILFLFHGLLIYYHCIESRGGMRWGMDVWQGWGHLTLSWEI